MITRRRLLQYGAALPLSFRSWITQTPERDLIAHLSERIPNLIEQYRVPGLSVSIIRDAQILWSQGFGVKSVTTKEPVSIDTVFEAASLSKPAFAYAVLRLFEKERYSLDAPLTEYVPQSFVKSFIRGEPRINLVTTRHVLSHTSGLPHGRELGSPIRLRFAPGSRFAYSATGMQYLQFVVEQLTKLSLRSMMRMALLEPFGMTRSSFGWLDRFAAEAAVGHGRSGRPGLSGNGEYLQLPAAEKERLRKEFPDSSDEASASAGLYTTAPDYAKFMIEMMGPRRRSDYHLSDAMLAEMLKPQIAITPEISWGLGWGVERTGSGDAFWHWGDWGVFRNFAIGFQERKAGIVILTNSFNGPEVYRQIILDAIGGTHPAFAWVNSYRP